MNLRVTKPLADVKDKPPAQLPDGLSFSTFPADSITFFRKASCSCGGECPSCQSNSGNLKISQPSDPAEIEADHIADRVMRMSVDDVRPKSNLSKNVIHRKCDACEDEEEEPGDLPVMRKETFASTAPTPPPGTPPSIGNIINSGGRPLDLETRSFFEPRFGADLSSVRIYTDGAAAESSHAINAKAYTLGSNIVFGRGEYQPESTSGQHLLAHELTHVVQQKKSGQGNKINRQCLPITECPRDSGGGLVIPGSATTFGAGEVLREAPARARRQRMSCSDALSTTHFGRARQLESLMDPTLLSRIHGIFIDADISPGTGALIEACDVWESRTLPAGCHPPSISGAIQPCVFVPARLNQEALQYNSGSPTIRTMTREDWFLQVILQTLTHEVQHATFETAVTGRAEPAGTAACPRASVFAEVTEINAILSEFPPIFRAIPASPGLARTHATTRLADWFHFKITNPSESLSGTLKAMRCTCNCPEVNAHVRDIFNFVTSSWTTAEKDALNAELRRAQWNIAPINLNWPL